MPPRIGQRNTAELVAVDALDPVVLGQPLIEERVVGDQQIGDTAILRSVLSTTSSVSLAIAGRRFSSKVGRARSGKIRSMLRKYRYWPMKFFTSSLERGSLSMRHLRRHHGLVGELAALRDRKQLVVWDAAPHEEREPRGELEVSDPVYAARIGSRRIVFRAEDEIRRHQDLLQRQSHAGFEAATLRAHLIERGELRHVLVRHRPPIGTVSESREDLVRAGLLVGARGRTAGENLLAARRCPWSSLYGPAIVIVPTPSK